MRQRIAARTGDERAAASRRMADRLLRLPEWKDARDVLLYASLPSEPDSDLLFRRARAEGKRVYYPFDRGRGRCLGFAEVEAIELLRPGMLGFREPPPVEREGTPQADLMLIPGIGFDREGRRLGRGSGYYDRTLAEFGAGLVRIGLFFSWQELPRVAADGYDERMDLIVTEEEVIRAGKTIRLEEGGADGKSVSCRPGGGRHGRK